MNKQNYIIKLIENTINQELEEIAISSSVAAKKKLALAVIETSNKKTFVLYKPFQIFGMLTVIYKPQCGAYEVTMSAAESGFGPLLYQAAMSIKGPNFIMADRTMVSDAALNIWKKFFNREDVVKEPLQKNCKYSLIDEDSKALNFKFTLKSPIDYSALENEHQTYIKKVDLHGKTKEQFLETLKNLANNFFREKYDE